MSEINTERLERLEEEWIVKSEDYDWLLQQARLVDEYAEVIDSQNKSLMKFQNENTKLREALQKTCDSLGADIDDYL